jgi:hypothetical protein
LTRASAQLWIASNAGTDASQWWADKLALGRSYVESDIRERVCLIEYAAAPDDDPADPATWYAAQPSLGVTYPEDAVRVRWDAAVASGQVDNFRREYLNVWTRDEVSAVPMDLWAECASDVALRQPCVLAVEVDLDRTVATIVAAAVGADGRVVVEVVDRAPGTTWVADRVDELVARWDPVAVGWDAGGPAAALALEVPGGVAVGTRDLAAASGSMHDALLAPRPHPVAHRSDPRLADAARATRRRPAGGSWLYDRRAVPHDASAWVGAVLARWLLAREVRHASEEPGIR